MRKLFSSPFFVPFIYFALNWRIWSGSHSFAHDTGDGIAAFKFSSFVPKYWNWFEAGGQPYWYDLARLQDPVSWLLLAPLRLLPIDPFTAYGNFMLLRMALCGLGFALLLRALGFSDRTRQLGVFVVLFGSVGASFYQQVGMLDLLFPFVFSLWCLIRLVQTNRGAYLAGLGILAVHGALGYHLVMLLPILAGLGVGMFFFFRDSLFSLGRTLKRHALGLATLAVGLSLLIASLFTMTGERGFLPMTRNLRYNTLVDVHGNNLNRDVYTGQNILDTGRFATSSEECHKSMHCSEYYADYLPTFLDPSLTALPLSVEFLAFIGRLALVIAILGLFRGRKKLGWLLGLGALGTFVLALGTQTPVWPVTQKIFPFLGYVRHTHFYISLMVLFLIGLFCVGLESLDNKKGWLRGIAFVTVVEILLFHFRFARPSLLPIDPAQRALVATPLPDVITAREARAFNPFSLPQTSVGTAYGRPTAMEPVNQKTQRPKRESDLDSFDIRFLGYPTPFMLRHTLRTRLLLSENPEAFKRAFGVKPYSILSLHPWSSLKYMDPHSAPDLARLAAGENEVALLMRNAKPKSTEESPAKYGIPLRIREEALTATFDAETPSVAYLSVPHPNIASVTLDGAPAEFYKANLFGLALSVPAGRHVLVVTPDLSVARKVFFFFYSGAFVLFLYLTLEIRRRRTRPLPEPIPFHPEVENLA